MQSVRARFVPMCQQVLALGVVLAALVPASRVVSLDVVGPDAARDILSAPMQSSATEIDLRAYAVESAKASVVATQPGEAHLREVALTAPFGAQGRMAAPPRRLVSAPQHVEGLGAIGVTWDPRSEVGDGEISLEVRSRTAAGWSDWSAVEYEAEHGPDPESPEGRTARPGTEAVVVGDVDQVQVRAASSAGSLPSDLTLSVIEPGTPVATTIAEPAIDTAVSRTAGDPTGDPTTDPATDPATDPGAEDETDPVDPDADEEGLELATVSVTPKPRIFSRAQWGADERARSASSLRYYEVHGGFVHHTVNANDYRRKDVPALMRSIYAYHTKSRGWSDIGYNFLVDRFGRIWEGRYGGVDRAVVGAHTLGYNDYGFAMSAIGNFEEVKPSDAMLGAYGALFAWKLSLHGVEAGSTTQRMGSATFKAISGHRDAGSTACPGRYLYKKISKIRKLAAELQADWASRELQPNLVGGPVKDLVLRRASDQMGVVVPLRRTRSGALVAGDPIETGLNLKRTRSVLAVGDWDLDGFGDILTHSKKGALRVRRGDGKGGFATATIRLESGYDSWELLSAAGDVTGDGYPDLIGQPAGGATRILPGAGTAGLAPSYAAYGRVGAESLVGVGRWNTDGTPDVVVLRDSVLTVWGTNGPGGLTGSLGITKDVRKYDWILGAGITGSSGHADLLVRKARNGSLYLLPGTTTGFGKRVLITEGFGDYDMVG
jgi:hypothetical protein